MPTKDSSSAVNLTVTDGSETATGTLELTFSSELSLPLIVSSTSVPLFPNLAFTYTILTASSDPFGKYYDFVGTLPPGLKLNPVTGKISGTFESPTRDVPGLALPGEVIGNVQLFAGNYHGTCSSPLVFRVPPGAANISTRLSVGMGDNVLIGGFITQGNTAIRAVARGIGPSLARAVC